MAMLSSIIRKWKHEELWRLILRSRKILIPALIITILLSGTVLAKTVPVNVNNKWDWYKVDGEQIREIHWSWCPECYEYLSEHPEWIQWISNAVNVWKAANTGWKLRYTSDTENCQVYVGFEDIPQPGSISVMEISEDGYLKKARITLDINPKNNPKDPANGWGTTGVDVYDPTVLGIHEFGHLLRLYHSYGSDDKMNVQGPGYHNYALSLHDIQEAKESNSSTGKKIRNIFSPFGNFESENGDLVFIPEGALPDGDSLLFDNIIDWSIPDKTNIDGSYISTAIELTSQTSRFNIPINISMTYQNLEINGGLVECVNFIYPPIIENELKVYKYNSDEQTWELISDSVVDTIVNRVTFETHEPGIYGISGPLEYEIIPPAKPSKPTGPSEGQIGIEYTFETNATNPLGGQVYYWFDWDDGHGSGWVGPYQSNEIGSASYTWDVAGLYKIRVKAKNDYGWESDWSEPLKLTMPRPRAFNLAALNVLGVSSNLILNAILDISSDQMSITQENIENFGVIK